MGGIWPLSWAVHPSGIMLVDHEIFVEVAKLLSVFQRERGVQFVCCQEVLNMSKVRIVLLCLEKLRVAGCHRIDADP